jgi:F0F1-type ATP synthase assembly protein I
MSAKFHVLSTLILLSVAMRIHSSKFSLDTGTTSPSSFISIFRLELISEREMGGILFGVVIGYLCAETRSSNALNVLIVVVCVSGLLDHW